MICPSCGTSLPSGVATCTACGRYVSPEYHVHGGPQDPRAPPPAYGVPPVEVEPAPPRPPTDYPVDVGKGPGFTPMVIAVVVAFLIVFLSALAWVYIDSEPYAPYEIEKVTVNLATPNIMRQEINGQPYWEAVLNINKITPRDEAVIWRDVRMVIKSSNGSVILPLTGLNADDALAYDRGTDGQVDLQVWFVETTPGTSRMDAGDAMKITGMTADFEGAFVQVLRDGERIGSITLPTNFP